MRKEKTEQRQPASTMTDEKPKALTSARTETSNDMSSSVYGFGIH
jgi:hypothetical protein